MRLVLLTILLPALLLVMIPLLDLLLPLLLILVLFLLLLPSMVPYYCDCYHLQSQEQLTYMVLRLRQRRTALLAA